jgi:hypothetical protein
MRNVGENFGNLRAGVCARTFLLFSLFLLLGNSACSLQIHLISAVQKVESAFSWSWAQSLSSGGGFFTTLAESSKSGEFKELPAWRVAGYSGDIVYFAQGNHIFAFGPGYEPGVLTGKVSHGQTMTYNLSERMDRPSNRFVVDLRIRCTE